MLIAKLLYKYLIPMSTETEFSAKVDVGRLSGRRDDSFSTQEFVTTILFHGMRIKRSMPCGLSKR